MNASIKEQIAGEIAELPECKAFVRMSCSETACQSDPLSRKAKAYFRLVKWKITRKLREFSDPAERFAIYVAIRKRIPQLGKAFTTL